MNQPGKMKYGAANQTSERHHALRHSQTCVLLDIPCTESKGASEGPLGLWISRLYQGFKVMACIPMRREEELIPSTLLQHNTYIMLHWRVCTHLCMQRCVQALYTVHALALICAFRKKYISQYSLMFTIHGTHQLAS